MKKHKKRYHSRRPHQQINLQLLVSLISYFNRYPYYDYKKVQLRLSFQLNNMVLRLSSLNFQFFISMTWLKKHTHREQNRTNLAAE